MYFGRPGLGANFTTAPPMHSGIRELTRGLRGHRFNKLYLDYGPFLRGRRQRNNFIARMLCSLWSGVAGDNLILETINCTMVSKEERRYLMSLYSSVKTYAHLKRKVSGRMSKNVIYKERPVERIFVHNMSFISLLW